MRFGPYLLHEQLGRGGMGDAHLATPIAEHLCHLPRVVVIKRLLAEMESDEDFVRRFRHEGLVAMLITSDHVARVYDVGEVQGTPYIAMEYVVGWTLSKVLTDYSRRGEFPAISVAIGIVKDCLTGLEAIHEAKDSEGRIGLVHRDVAPKNTMLGTDGHARLIDLGLGRSSLGDWRTRTGAVMGTPGYMPPEQARGERVDSRGDLYSVGSILYELLTLQPLIRRDRPLAMLMAAANPPLVSVAALRPEIPPELEAAVLRGLAPEANERFASAREFREALADVAPEDEPTRIHLWIGPRDEGDLVEERTLLAKVTGLASLTPVEPTEIQTTAERPLVAPMSPHRPGPLGMALTGLGVVGAFLLGRSVDKARPEPAVAPQLEVTHAATASPTAMRERDSDSAPVRPSTVQASTVAASAASTPELATKRKESRAALLPASKAKSRSPAASPPKTPESVQPTATSKPRASLDERRQALLEKTAALLKVAQAAGRNSRAHDLIELRAKAKEATDFATLDRLASEAEELEQDLGN